MARKLDLEEIRLRYKPGLREIYNGYKYYRFYQKDYFRDFLDFYSSSAFKTYERVAEMIESDKDGRTIQRYHDYILFGKEVLTHDIAEKLVKMLIKLQRNLEFNPKHHVYVEEIGMHKDAKFVYEWDNKRDKWGDIVTFDEKQKIQIVAGYIYELLNIIAESDFFNLKLIDQTDAEKGYYSNKIKEIYGIIDELYIGNPDLSAKWNRIMNPVRDMICKYEFPGVYNPIWMRANEAITYFDVAYDIANSNPKLFEQIMKGETAFRFSIAIDQDMIERRERYILEKKQEDQSGNVCRSELQLFEQEMKIALKNIVCEFEAL